MEHESDIRMGIESSNVDLEALSTEELRGLCIAQGHAAEGTRRNLLSRLREKGVKRVEIGTPTSQPSQSRFRAGSASIHEPNAGDPPPAPPDVQVLQPELSNAEILSWMKANVATKNDVVYIVRQATEPMKEQMSKMQDQLDHHDDDIDELRAKLSASNIQPKIPPPDLNQLQVAFSGFESSLDGGERVRQIEALMAKHPSHKFAHIGNYYTGAVSNRKLSPASYIQFCSRDDARLFLEKLGGRSVVMSGENIKVKFAMTPLLKQRNWTLKQVEQLIAGDPASTGKRVKANYQGKSRTVTVDDEVAFEQFKESVSGRLKAPCAHLPIPH